MSEIIKQNSQQNSQQMWGGRFEQGVHEMVEEFTASVAIDKELALYDIMASIAHAKMLAKVDVLTADETNQIIAGLEKIAQQINRGEFKWLQKLEDVHMNIEAALVDLIGDVGKKLHTARSRNDQVATDMRLYLRDAVDEICVSILKLQEVLLGLAMREAETIMPGFTHLQIAQPVTFGHHIMAWHSMLERDYQRFSESRVRINQLPLGAAALAGTTYPIDREYTAQLLGFASCITNSLDAVSDRDFVIEFVAAAAMTMSHLSRWSEELILWSCPQFGFVNLPDKFCTGSSIMPQKKNPDVAELIRGKSSSVLGNLVALFNLMKAQPLAYNRDNQEDKQPLFDSTKTVTSSLKIYTLLLQDLEVNREKMLSSTQQGFITATDLADYLVVKGEPFRSAHAIVGRLVAIAIKQGCGLEQLSLALMQEQSSLIKQDVFDALKLETSLAKRNHIGATSIKMVKEAIATARSKLVELQKINMPL